MGQIGGWCIIRNAHTSRRQMIIDVVEDIQRCSDLGGGKLGLDSVVSDTTTVLRSYSSQSSQAYL